MHVLRWNLCTTFGAAGAGLAYAVLLAVFGVYWQLIPGAVAGLVAAYVVSTLLGALAIRLQLGRYLASSLIFGVSAGLLTLVTGAVAIGFGNFAVESIAELVRAPSGQPFWNVLAEVAPNYAADFIAQPVLAGGLFGFLPASVLGGIYGARLHARFEARSEPTGVSGKAALGVTGIALLFVVLLGGAFMLPVGGQLLKTGLPADLPIAVGGCGQLPLSNGMLAWCSGHPCENGQCQWETKQDAFAVYVQPPHGSEWSWVGGGIGSTRRPDVIRHTVFWVQREANGFILESSPRRHVNYQLRLAGEAIEIGDQRFAFVPGMLIGIQFSDDWSVTARVGIDALRDTGVTLRDLQSELDQVCTSQLGCENAFRIRPASGR